MQRSLLERMPERVGRYEILVPIASGGMATVYLGRARGAAGFERDVAIKLTHAHLRTNPDFARALVDEAKLAVSIRHANVVPVLDVGDDPLGLFLVMEYVEGDTLSGLMRRARSASVPLGPHIGMRLLLDALAGLHAAHELKDETGNAVGLVHRDFSPQNILVGLDGIGRLTDFGIAKAATRLGHTTTGVVKGKIAYMAPEQARGEGVDRRCDVWAGGVLAWEILAGRRMYEEASDDIGLIFRIATVQPPRLRSIDRRIPASLDDVVARALTHDRNARFATAAELARELVRALRSSRMPIAESGEVAEYVEKVSGERLAARRKRAAEVGELRRKLGIMTAPLEPMTETPNWSALEQALGSEGLEDEPHTAPAPPPAPGDDTVVDVQSASKRLGVPAVVELAPPPAPDPAPHARWKLVAAAGAPLAGILIVTGIIAAGVTRTRAPEAVTPAQPATSVLVEPEAPAPSDTEAAAVEEPAPSMSASSPPVAKVRAPPSPPPVSRPATARPTALPAPTKKTPDLSKPF